MKYYTTREVSEMLGMSETTIRRWRWSGEGPAATVVGSRAVRYSEEALTDWLKGSNE